MGKGGGGDGGALASGRFLVRERKEDRGSKDRERWAQRQKWRTCALSGAALAAPIVADAVGHLLNKDAVIQYLLAGRSVPAFAHIKSLKRDVFAVRPTPAAAAALGGATVAGGAGGGPPLFMCPITREAATGAHTFVALRPCGCVLSLAALAELKADVCPACSKPFTPPDVVQLCPTDAEEADIRAELAARKAAAAAATAGAGAAAAAASGSGSTAGSGDAGSAPRPPTLVATAPTADGGRSSSGSATAPAAVSGVKRQREGGGGDVEGERKAAGGGGGSSSGGAGRHPTAPPPHTAAPTLPTTAGTARHLATTAAGAAARTVAAQRSSSAVFDSLFSHTADTKGGARRW